MSQDLPELLERHRRWWHCEPVDRPLIGELRQGSFFLQPFLDLGVSEGMLALEDVPDPEAFIEPYYEKTFNGDARDGDMFWVAKPPRTLPWMEAIVGCGVYVSASSKATTAIAPDVLPDLDRIDLESNGWLRLMTAFTDCLARHFGDRYPVGQTLMRGPSDMMAALLGQQFYIELYDNPAPLKKLAQQCTDIWIKVLQIQNQHIPLYHGGYMSGLNGIWAPGTAAIYQEDAAGFISEAMYREVFLECDVKIAAAFDYTLLHLHSASLQILNAVLEIPQLASVNVVVDPLGPKLTAMLPQLQGIQAAGKSLHLHGPLSPEDIELARSNLSPNGLAIWLVFDK